jgi:hypothetical protein
MEIVKVFSCNDGWDKLNYKHGEVLTEILDSIQAVTHSADDKDTKSAMLQFMAITANLEKLLISNSWSRRSFGGDRWAASLYCEKDDIPFFITANARTILEKWIFNLSALAVEKNPDSIPVLIVFMKRLVSFASNGEFMNTKNVIESLSPINCNFPFVILYITDDGKATGLGREIIKIESRSQFSSERPLHNQCIEFPPQYHIAGVNILNYFGSYIRNKYPDAKVKVKIEQEGTKVRLIINAEDGYEEIVEEALEEYQLIVSNGKPPEYFITDRFALLEMKSQLYAAEAVIKSQGDLLEARSEDIRRYGELLTLALSKNNNIKINVSPHMINSSNVNANNYIASAVGSLSELVEVLKEQGADLKVLEGLIKGLKSMDSAVSAEDAKVSPALSKLKRYIEKSLEAGNDANEILSKAGEGVEIVKELGKKYNKIAEWCFLPVIPSSLLE